MTTKEYRAILAAQLQALAGIDNEEMIELQCTKTNPANK
jgi:hypothetical protein